MFSQACVIHSVQRVCVSRHALREGVYAWGCQPSDEVSTWECLPSGGVCTDTDTPPSHKMATVADGTHPTECILVFLSRVLHQNIDCVRSEFFSYLIAHTQYVLSSCDDKSLFKINQMKPARKESTDANISLKAMRHIFSSTTRIQITRRYLEPALSILSDLQFYSVYFS